MLKQTPLPDTASGKLMTQWLQLCSHPDAKEMTKWAAANLSERALKHIGAENFGARESRNCAATGGYQVLEIKEAKQEMTTLLAVANKTGSHVQMRIAVDPAGKLRGFGAMPTAVPASALPKDASDESVANAMNTYVSKLASADQFSGVVMLVRGTKPIMTTTQGVSDRSTKSRMAVDSQFTLGSMSKMFTAAAVGQLVDQHKLSFDDVVGKFFPDFPNKTVREKVTVGMLLSHTSGMGDFLDKRSPEMMKGGVKRASDFMPLYQDDEPQFEPGKGWSYSNAAFALAGAIIEKVSGEDYPAYLRNHIFDVAGMKNSDANTVPLKSAKLVRPYTAADDPQSPDRWKEAEHDIGSPAGGAVSTAEDLVRFADALHSGKFVSKSTLEAMTASQGKAPWGADYGYGFELDTVQGKKVFGHGGGFPGVSTHLYMFADAPYTAVVLANQDPPAAEFVGEMAKALLAAKANGSK